MQLVEPQARDGDRPQGAQPLAWLRTARDTSVQLVRRVATLRQKAPGSDAQAESLAGTLGEVIEGLDCLNRATEQDFLRIGGKLAEFIEVASLISSELEALASLISGEHGLRASNALTAALERSRDMTARAAEGKGLLGGMRSEAGRLRQNLSGFEATVSRFRTLGVLTRIETARLGNAGADFAYLADEVGSLAGDVQAKVQAALDGTALLILPIEAAIQNAAALEEGQARDLPSVISQVLAKLSSSRDMQGRVHDSSVRLRARYDAISDSFKKLIVSLQFHDITRQQVEHAADALRGLVSESDGEGGGLFRACADTAAVLALQSSQLADAGAKFDASVESVVRNLDEIAGSVLEMAEGSRTLSGLSADETNSFLVQLEKACAAILASLTICAGAQAAVQASGTEITQTIGRARGPLNEIRSIGLRMQRMALNARIRATHLGASGDVLSVLAESMQQVASECEDRSVSLFDALQSIRAAAAGIAGQDGQAPDGQRTSDEGWLEGMRVAVLDLHSSNERCFAQIAQIVARGARLSEAVAATRKTLCAGAVFAETIARSRRMIEAIAEESRSVPWRDEVGGAEPGLRNIAQHYTMQAEREVHRDVTRALAGEVPTAERADPLESTPQEAGEVGESVEFF